MHQVILVMDPQVDFGDTVNITYPTSSLLVVKYDFSGTIWAKTFSGINFGLNFAIFYSIVVEFRWSLCWWIFNR